MTFTCNSSQLQSTDSFEVFILWTSVYDETAAPVIRNLNTHPVSAVVHYGRSSS